MPRGSTSWPKGDRAPGRLFLRIIGPLLLVLLVTNAAAARAEIPYRFGPGDVLSISVFGQEALSGRFKISPDGIISFPLLGEVAVVNLSKSELEAKIRSLLAQQLPGAGRVTADVAEYAPVFILGDVEKPGRYEFRPGMIPLELLALGGGMKRLLLDPQREPTLQLIVLEQELSDQRLLRYGEAVTRARLLAEIAGRNFDGTIDPAGDQPIMLEQKQRILNDEKALFRVRAEVLANRQKSLKQQRDSYNQEISALTQSIALHDEELKIVGQETSTSQGLVNRGLATEPRLLAQKRDLSATRRNALDLRVHLARAQQSQLDVELKIEELQNTRANELAKELREIDMTIARTDEKLAATSSSLAALRSDGTRRSLNEPASITFEVVRLIEGEYRKTQIGEHDRLEPRDILQVNRQLANPTRAATPLQGGASPSSAAAEMLRTGSP
jgi:polysaccharide export outer membrane protein